VLKEDKSGQKEQPEHAVHKVEGLVRGIPGGGSSPLRRIEKPVFIGLFASSASSADGAEEARMALSHKAAALWAVGPVEVRVLFGARATSRLACGQTEGYEVHEAL